MLKLRIKHSAAKAEALVVPLGPGTAVPDAAQRAAMAVDFRGAVGQTCEAFAPHRRLLLVGIGAQATPAALQGAGARAAGRLLALERIALDVRGLTPELAAAFAAGVCLRGWRYERLRTQSEADAPERLAAVDLLCQRLPAVAAAWAEVAPGVQGALFARDLVAEPADTLTPKGFVRRLRDLTRHGLELTVLRRGDLRREGLGALLAVSGGSARAPRLVELRWPGRGATPPVVFVGQGVTFDSGGLCVRSAERLETRHAEMAGAAAAVGAMLALALRRSPAGAVAVVPLAENAIGAASYRPGDVVRCCDGRTVEVVNTAHDGRLLLADALAWTARRHKPRAMVSIATLTQAVVTALGHHLAGLFDNDAALAAHLAAAAATVDEPVWRLPIGEGHRAALNSDIADLRQSVPETYAPDACHAAALLHAFAGATPWAHLDISGVHRRDEPDELRAAGPTGFGVRLLDRLVAHRFEAEE